MATAMAMAIGPATALTFCGRGVVCLAAPLSSIPQGPSAVAGAAGVCAGAGAAGFGAGAAGAVVLVVQLPLPLPLLLLPLPVPLQMQMLLLRLQLPLLPPHVSAVATGPSAAVVVPVLRRVPACATHPPAVTVVQRSRLVVSRASSYFGALSRAAAPTAAWAALAHVPGVGGVGGVLRSPSRIHAIQTFMLA